MSEPDENQIRTFSIRLEQWLYDKLIAAAGQKTKNEYIKAVLIEHLKEPLMNQNEPDVNQARTTNEPDREFLRELELKDEIIKSKDQTIRTLENQAGFLISEFQRMSGINERLLMPGQAAPEVKKWWQVWK